MKVTKRERKIASERLAGIEGRFTQTDRSITQGDQLRVGYTQYHGRNPVFAPIKNAFGDIVSYKKISKGIPFVRSTAA